MKRAVIAFAAFLFASVLQAQEQKEGGIIGTGVIGQVTGVTEFEVSGMRFGIAADVALSGIQSIEDIDLGMMLAARTAQDGNAWEITELRRVPVLSGPVTGPNEVLGVPVRGDVPASGWVVVDGFWTDDAVVATRVSAAAERAEVQITGMFDPAGFVGLVPINPEALGARPKGALVTVLGRYAQAEIIVDSVAAGAFAEEVPDLVLLEGFYQSMGGSREVTLQGIGKADRDLVSVTPDALVRQCAVNGRLDFVESTLSPADIATIASFCVSANAG